MVGKSNLIYEFKPFNYPFVHLPIYSFTHLSICQFSHLLIFQQELRVHDDGAAAGLDLLRAPASGDGGGGGGGGGGGDGEGGRGGLGSGVVEAMLGATKRKRPVACDDR